MKGNQSGLGTLRIHLRPGRHPNPRHSLLTLLMQAFGTLDGHLPGSRHSLRHSLLALLVTTTVLSTLSCGDQEVEVLNGSEVLEPELPLLVSIEDVSHEVLLSNLPSEVDQEGKTKVRLSEAILEADHEIELEAFSCDFVAADGFRSSDMGEGCEPLPCEQTNDAWINLETRDLSWPPEMGMRGCHAPRDLARVELSRGH